MQAVKTNQAEGEVQTPQPTDTLLIFDKKHYICSTSTDSREREERLTCWQTCQVASGTKKGDGQNQGSVIFSRLTIPYCFP